MNEPVTELRMEIRGLLLDPASNVPIVILRDPESQLFLPIWIGPYEANAIAQRMEGIEPPRPMTHDLLKRMVESLGASVEKIIISDLQDNTFFAIIQLKHGEHQLEVDARPSDAIALALRAQAPIFVRQAVLDKAKLADIASQATDEERLKKWLEEVSSEDLGKWTMEGATGFSSNRCSIRVWRQCRRADIAAGNGCRRADIRLRQSLARPGSKENPLTPIGEFPTLRHTYDHCNRQPEGWSG
jgi:uncharacterized protein